MLGAAGPDILKAFEGARRVMCVQPHPDDCDLGAGGAVAKLSRAGARIIYVTMTDGSRGTYDPAISPDELARIRMKEQEEAAEVLGVSELVWLGYRDTELAAAPEARNKLITLIRKYRPDLILTVDPWLPYEAHPDHVATGLLTAQAAIFSPLPHVNPNDLKEGLSPYSVPLMAFYWTREPNLFIDITGFLELKLRAIASHRSQFPPGALEVVEGYLRTYSELMGKRIGVAYAEAFKALPPLYLHIWPFAEGLGP